MLRYFFSICVFFLPKLYFHKKRKQNIKKKENSCFFFCSFFKVFSIVGCKFLLIKGDGQLDRHTDKQISWLINTKNYRCEKRSEIFSMLHCTHGQKVTTAVFFLSLLHRAVLSVKKKQNKTKQTEI